MFKAEKKFLDFIEKNIFKIAIFFVTVLALYIRVSSRDYIGQDATYALLPWYDEIKAGGGLKSLAHQVGNYNIVYQFLIALMTYIPIEPIYAYKMLSYIFDFALAIAVAYLVHNMSQSNKEWKSFFAYSMVVLSPIVFLNSGVWAQCDSIYVFFAVVSIIYLMKEKYISAFVLLGISFAFKLQAVFILPLFLIVYFVKKKFSILHFLIIPAVMMMSGLPAVIMGRSILEPFKIYLEQSDTYKSMFCNYPSFWALTCAYGNQTHYQTLKTAAILLTIAVLAIFMIILIIKKIEFNHTNLIYITFILSYVCVLFLPAMHDRYGYIFEILSIVIVFMNRKTIPLMIPLWMITLCSYSKFLLGVETDMRVLAVFNCLVFAGYVYILMKSMFHEKAVIGESYGKKED